MKVWLDDSRPAPEGWVHAKWPDEAIAWLQTGSVSEISLDHDLGDDRIGTGYDVLLWIERQVATADMIPPIIHVHSANSSARVKMLLAIKSINRLAKQNVE